MSIPPPQPHSRAAIPLARSLDPTLAEEHLPRRFRPLDTRVIGVSVVAVVHGAVVAGVAALLTGLIGLVTNLAFCGRWETTLASPAGHPLGAWVIALGSGTSGGTLALLFTIGSTLGGALGLLIADALPALHVDPGWLRWFAWPRFSLVPLERSSPRWSSRSRPHFSLMGCFLCSAAAQPPTWCPA